MPQSTNAISSSTGAYQQQSLLPKDIMGQDDFLRLLITQLQNQDPLEPMDQKETIAQLAQFQQLDQMRNVATLLEYQTQQSANDMYTLASLQEALINAQSVTLIGKPVRAIFETLNVSGETVPRIVFDVPEGIANVTVTIRNAAGDAVKVQELGNRDGEVSYDLTGLPEGTYTVDVEATLPGGGTAKIRPYLNGEVTRIWFSPQGARLEVEGQIVGLGDIAAISTT